MTTDMDAYKRFHLMTEWDHRLEFDEDGTVHMRGYKGFQEPTCGVCKEPIRWVLDMYSFTTGPNHTLAHARCVWTPEAFIREANKALDRDDLE